MTKLALLILYSFLFIYKAVAHPGIGIVMDNDRNVFYTDLNHVWKISTDGNRTIAVENVHTHELYIDADGNLYGEHEWYYGEQSDKWGNYVWCLNKNGILKKVIPDVEGFLENTTLIRDSSGNSYWPKKQTNGEILMKKFVDGANRQITNHKFNDIRWMHYSNFNDNLYVVDHLSVKKITPSGEVAVLAENLKEENPPFESVADHHYIFGIWTDARFNVFVALYGAGKVVKINSTGKVSTIFTSNQGWSPCGGMIGKDGSLWVMEFSSGNGTRVRKIVHNGPDLVYGS